MTEIHDQPSGKDQIFKLPKGHFSLKLLDISFTLNMQGKAVIDICAARRKIAAISRKCTVLRLFMVPC